MAYITQTNITDRISEAELILITTDDPAAVAPDSDKVNAAIADADGVIDSYVGKRYVVPMTDVPKVIVRHCVSLAVSFLYRDRSTPRDDENIKDNYDEAIAFLKDISVGKAILHGVSSTTELSPADANVTMGYFDAEDRVFTRDNLTGF